MSGIGRLAAAATILATTGVALRLASRLDGPLGKVRKTIREDVAAVFERDPAARSVPEVLLCYPGLHAIWLHRLAHKLYRDERYLSARLVSHAGRLLTGIEIHPGARIGRRCVIDHGMGTVIGETSEIGDDALIYQGVTLGGVSLAHTKRHPSLGNRITIGAGAKILGPITVGDGAVVGAGSVVTRPVPPGARAVGVPARFIEDEPRVLPGPAPSLDHANLPDPIARVVEALLHRIERLERAVEEHDRAGIEAHASTAADEDARVIDRFLHPEAGRFDCGDGI